MIRPYMPMAVEESFQVKLSIMTIAEGATVHSLAQRIVESIQTQDDAAEPNGMAAQVAAVAAQHALDVSAHALADVNALGGGNMHGACQCQCFAKKSFILGPVGVLPRRRWRAR